MTFVHFVEEVGKENPRVKDDPDFPEACLALLMTRLRSVGRFVFGDDSVPELIHYY